jgi:hypothetical protein
VEKGEGISDEAVQNPSKGIITGTLKERVKCEFNAIKVARVKTDIIPSRHE